MAETRLRTKREAEHLGHRKEVVYLEKYDAYACKQCNKWLEKRCSDRKCPFCSKRSRRPNR